MGSRPPKDNESPSSSTIFLPQLRHSRRGSIASLSSISQIDKETLSQALDQIHHAASHSETLTTFNEFTAPPSSSSALDNKGIASELQGGISGLYNRFRASVGTAKDVPSAGIEDDAAERLSVGSITKSSPAPSTKASVTPTHAANQSPAPGPDEAQASVYQPSISISTKKNLFGQPAIESRQAKTEAPIESDVVSGLAPSTPSLIIQTEENSLMSVGGKSNPGVTKRANVSAGIGTKGDLVKSAFSSAKTQAPPAQATTPERPLISRKFDSSSTRSSLVHQSSQTHKPALSSTNADKARGNVDIGEYHSPNRTEPSSPTTQATKEQVYPQVTSESISGANSSTDRSPFAVDEDNGADSSKLAVGPDQISNLSALSDQTSRSIADGRKDRPQHSDLASRKSTAPPLVSHAKSPGRHESRASSTDTNSDTFNSAPHRTPVRQSNNNIKSPSRALPIAQTTLQRDPRMMHSFSHSRNKVLNKEYWMKDENARDCFNCGEAFSTFRRKHHCRICGQIFDSRCTSILSGENFGHAGPLRVCKPCETMVNNNDDFSEISDDGSLTVSSFRTRHRSTAGSDRGDIFTNPLPRTDPTDYEAFHRNPGPPDLTIPTMSIPATRKAGENASRKSTVLEIGSSHTLARPSSSRSLKSAMAGRSHGGGHRRFNSRALQRGFKPVREDEAPFHQDVVGIPSQESRLPVFHDDNVIDPDLAPYLSEEGSSGDEQMSIMAALHGNGFSKSYDSDRHVLPGITSNSRKGRSRHGDSKSLSTVAFASRDSDNHSLQSTKMANTARSVKRRNLSFSGTNHLRPSPRGHRATLATSGSGLNLQNLHESISSPSLAQTNPSGNQAGGTRMTRSSSMKGDAAPAIELNSASLQHVKKLLHQLLVDSKVLNVANWEKALIPILLRATDDVNPDVQGGDDIDIRHYVKFKKIPGGRPSDTSYVSGLVFTKNLALKSMPRNIAHPNILILAFPLEYARHQQHFMSLEPVVRQEREFLQNLVNRIAALKPDLLLVERNVSGLAIELLARAKIATAYNVKSSVLEAVSRCCQTRIISSIDKLAIKPAYAGKCASFFLQTHVNKGRKTTYMFLSGCAKELGCTVVLRGDDEATLSKMKRITEFMTYVVYNLQLETCLMKDEYASIPVVVGEGSLSNSKEHAPRAKLPQPSNIKQAGVSPATGRAGQSLEAGTIQATDREGLNALSPQDTPFGEDQKDKAPVGLPEEDSVPDDVPMPTFYSDMVEEHKTKILSASPFVKFMQPYLLMRAREQERRLAYLKRLCDQDILEEQKGDEKPKVEKFDLIKPEMVHETVPNASRKVREVLHAVHDAEYDKALHIYQTQTKQWETHIAGSIDLFDPYVHQSIAVLYSVVCTVTTVPCSGPDLVALGFYNEHDTDANLEADCTLGQYVEDLCLGANTVCTSNGCEKTMMEHHRQYVHGEVQLSMFVERYPCKIQDMQESILMWSICRICEKETPAMLMSENTWKYSFGKYLELSFWSSDMKARADICPHDLHRDHLRYFGYRNMALRVHYDPITLLEIIVPRARITWKVDNDLRFKNDIFTRIEDRLNKYMLSVRARIKSINTESVVAEKVEACKEEVEKLAKKAADEHQHLVQKLRKRYMNSKHYEILPLNRAIRATQEKVAEWDNAFTEFDRNFLPSEKDIRRLATLQLKSIFMETDDTGRSSGAEAPMTSNSHEILSEKSANGDALAPQTRDMSPEKADKLLASVVEKHVGGDNPSGETFKHFEAATVDLFDRSDPTTIDPDERKSVRPPDLAVTSEPPKKSQEDPAPNVDSPADSAALVRNDLVSVGIPSLQETELSSTKQIAKQNDAKPSNYVPAFERTQPSNIPRPVELTHRTTKSYVTPSSARAKSNLDHVPSNTSSSDGGIETVDTLQQSKTDTTAPNLEKISTATKATKSVEKKLSERLGLHALKAGGAVAQSMIPRSIGGNKGRISKVSSLARHFEQLSREFERERIKERRQRQAGSGQSRAYPIAVSKPIVQIYRNVHEAVEEKEPSEEELSSPDPSQLDQKEQEKISQVIAENQGSAIPGEASHEEEVPAFDVEADKTGNDGSRTGSDGEGGGADSDEDYTVFDDPQVPGASDEHHALTEQEAQLDLRLDLPKHEKSSILRMLTNFWAERTASGWQPLDYPLNATDHIFADSDVIVREDEPSSLIALALNSEDYQLKLSSISDCTGTSSISGKEGEMQDSAISADDQLNVEQSLLRSTGIHLKYQFSESSAKMQCKVFYAEQFDAVRRKCGVSERFVESLSRCMKWDSKGGKTKSVFLKTLDDRFVLKSLSQIETQAFLRFAPAYFRIISESLFHELPSVIAKMLGFYQVIIKNPATGVDFNWFLLVMENLFYDRSPTRIFDLKGSMRNRRIQSTGEQNEVLLDENMVEFIYESPLFSREHSKKLLRASVWNDTLFLAGQNVMDYSLMIAIDENRKELVVGIIDCIRTYTWDKKLESWIKDRGKNRPTVTSPKEYKSRFREAMGRYVLQAPNCWHQFEGRQQSRVKPLSMEDHGDERALQIPDP